MPDFPKIRQLLDIIKLMAVHLTDDEIDQLLFVLLKATQRMENSITNE